MSATSHRCKSQLLCSNLRIHFSILVVLKQTVLYKKNPQQIEVLELEGYSRSTCSKQPRLVDCPIGVVNKLDSRRRRRRRVLLTTRSTCRGDIIQVRSLNHPQGIKAILQVPELSYSTVYDEGSSNLTKNQLDSFICFNRTPTCEGQTHDDSIRRASTASRSKNEQFMRL